MKYYTVSENYINIKSKKDLKPEALIDALDGAKQFFLFDAESAEINASHGAVAGDKHQYVVYEARLKDNAHLTNEKFELTDREGKVVQTLDAHRVAAKDVILVSASLKHANDKLADINVEAEYKKRYKIVTPVASESESEASESESEATDNEKATKETVTKADAVTTEAPKETVKVVTEEKAEEKAEEKKTSDTEEPKKTWKDTAKKYAIPAAIAVTAGAAFFAFGVPAVAPILAAKGMAAAGSLWFQAGLSAVVGLAAAALTEATMYVGRAIHSWWTTTPEQAYNESNKANMEKFDKERRELGYGTDTELGKRMKEVVANAPVLTYTDGGKKVAEEIKNDRNVVLNFEIKKLEQAKNLKAAAANDSDATAKAKAQTELTAVEKELVDGPAKATPKA